MIWPKRPPLAFSVAETSVAEMSGPKRPRPKSLWPKCPTFVVFTEKPWCTVVQIFSWYPTLGQVTDESMSTFNKG